MNIFQNAQYCTITHVFYWTVRYSSQQAIQSLVSAYKFSQLWVCSPDKFKLDSFQMQMLLAISNQIFGIGLPTSEYSSCSKCPVSAHYNCLCGICILQYTILHYTIVLHVYSPSRNPIFGVSLQSSHSPIMFQ